MQIALTQRGGVFGVNRKVIVDDTGVSLAGDRRGRRSLDPAQRQSISELARNVIVAAPRSGPLAPPAPDAMQTKLEIRDGDRHHVFRSNGDTREGTDELWDLIGRLSEAADDIEAGQARA